MKWFKVFLVVTLFTFGVIFARPVRAGPSQVGGRVSPDGAEEITCDLPGGEHLKNTGGLGRGGPGTGAGLCVFTSIEHSGRWQNVEALRGLQQKMTHEPGGGWPEKVDQMLHKYAPGVGYVQYTGKDPAVLRLALKTGRMPAVTYGYSPRYGGGRIAHMVNLVHLSDRWACVLDNNFPGENQYEWMAPEEFLRRWKLGNDGGGWAVVQLAPAPPPIPVNLAARPRARYGWTQAVAAWGSGGCPPAGPVGPPAPLLVPAPPVFAPAPAPFEWRRFPDDPDEVALWRGGAQVGGYRYSDDVFRPYDPQTRTWGPAGWPPVAPPRRAAARPRVVQNFGVKTERLPGGETYSVNGRAVSGAEAHQAVRGGGTLNDDSSRWRLTVVGTVAECTRVLADLQTHPALAPWRDHLLVQAYRPDAWAVTGVGLPHDGHPSIVVEGPPDARGRGRVLHRQLDYGDGADGLAGALRKIDPSHDPGRDPDLRKPAPAAPGLPQLPSWLWAAAGVALTLLAPRLAPPARLLFNLLKSRLATTPPQPSPDPALRDLLARLLKRLEEKENPAPCPPSSPGGKTTSST